MQFVPAIIFVMFLALALPFLLWSVWHYFSALRIRGRRSRKFAYGMTTVLLLAVVVYSGWRYRVERGIHKEVSRIQELGEPLKFSDLAPPVADDGAEDAGRYYAAAIKLWRKSQDGEEKAASGVWDTVRKGPDEPMDNQAVAALQAILERNAASMAMLDRATEIEECRMGLGSQSGTFLLVDEVGPPSTLSWIAFRRAALCLHEGRTKDAVHSALAALRVERVLGKQTLIAHFVRIACWARGAEAAVMIVRHGRVTTEDLGRLDRSLGAADREETFEEAMMAERLYVLALLGVTLESSPPMIASAHIYQVIPKLARRQLALEYLHYAADVVDAAGEPWPAKIDAVNAVRAAGYYRLMFDVPLGPCVAATGRSLAGLRAARLAILCEVYRREYGSAPKNLDDLVPQYCDALPLDPFDGKPMKYKRDGEALVIYSVGENGVDDGGGVDRIDDKHAADWGFRVTLPGA